MAPQYKDQERGQPPVSMNKDLMEHNHDYVLWWLSYQSQFWADIHVWLKILKYRSHGLL